MPTVYAKRAMATDRVAARDELGAPRFLNASHDRSARVGYRMALDNPQRIASLAVLNILPTIAIWERLDTTYAMEAFRWLMLAQPPTPPRADDGAGTAYLYASARLSDWT